MPPETNTLMAHNESVEVCHYDDIWHMFVSVSGLAVQRAWILGYTTTLCVFYRIPCHVHVRCVDNAQLLRCKGATMPAFGITIYCAVQASLYIGIMGNGAGVG